MTAASQERVNAADLVEDVRFAAVVLEREGREDDIGHTMSSVGIHRADCRKSAKSLRSLAASLRELTPERIAVLRKVVRDHHRFTGLHDNPCDCPDCINARAALSAIDKIVGAGNE